MSEESVQGFKTTEFGAMIAAAAAAIFAALSGLPESVQITTIVVAGVVIVAYIWSRTQVKNTKSVTKASAEIAVTEADAEGGGS